jgi:hypothetical protein
MTKKKNRHAVALERLGSFRGGKIRAAKLTFQERSEIALNAVLARWEKARKSKCLASAGTGEGVLPLR